MESYKTTTLNSNIHLENCTQQQTPCHDPQEPTKAKKTTNK
jgi:hypothetical protein